MQKADDMVLILVADRITRHALLQRRLDIILPGILKIQTNHIRARHHNVAGTTVGKIKDIIQISQLSFINIAMLMAFLHQDTDFVLVVRLLRFARSINTHTTQRPVGHMVQKPYCGIHNAVEENQRTGNE